MHIRNVGILPQHYTTNPDQDLKLFYLLLLFDVVSTLLLVLWMLLMSFFHLCITQRNLAGLSGRAV
jgi:hypothetical protein